MMVKFAPDPKEKPKAEQAIRLGFFEIKESGGCNFIAVVEEDQIGQIDKNFLLIEGNNEYILKVIGGWLPSQPKDKILRSDENCVDAFATTYSKSK